MRKENTTHVLLIIVSLLTLAGVAVMLFCMKGYVANAIEHNEAMKVGGMENYEKLKQLYSSDWFKDAQKQQIESALSQGAGGQAGAQQPSGTQEEIPSGTLNADQISKMKANTYVMGKADAKVTIIEYSDPECPFCIRHYNDNTIESVMETFDGEVNHIVKAVQGVNHTNTESKSLALLCAGKLGGDEAYYGMYDKIMGQSTPEAPVANSKVASFATELGLNASQFNTCVESKELLSQYSANRQEALSLQSGGTPGNLIINNETGEYRLVSGAYPASTFTEIIGAWLN